MTARTSSFLKRFFLILGIATLFQLILSAALYMASFRETKNILEREISNHFISVEKRISTELTGVIRDLSLIARSPLLSSFSPDRISDLRKAEQLFTSLIESRSVYDQIRYIDYRGNEKVRLNRQPDGTGKAVLFRKLQQKAHRYYFTEAIRFDPGTVYLSRLDLNREGGVLESPDKPTIRIITVVKDKNGKKGLIIVNFLAQSLLDLIAERDHPGEYSLWMINSAGHFFKGPSKKFEWGFDYTKRAKNTFTRLIPRLGRKILRSQLSNGSIDTGSRRIIFKKISQAKMVQKVTSTLFNGVTRSRYAKDWYLVGQVSIGNMGRALLVHFIKINVLGTLCFIVISLWAGGRAVANYDGMIKKDVIHKESEEDAVHAASYLQNAYHEIYAPLNGVISSSSLLHESPLNRYQKQLLRVLDTSGKSLMGIIDDIPNQHLLENGKVILKLSVFDLKKNIEDVAEMMALLAFSKGVEFQIQIDPKLEQWWRGDLVRLKRLMVVLLSHSIRLTNVGKITLKVSHSLGHGVDFEVSDTGRQLTHAELQFSGQEHTNVKGEIDSDLYGLSVFKTLSESMGGTISVSSNRGEGNSYTFSLPLSYVGHEHILNYPSHIKKLRFMTISMDEVVSSNIKDAVDCIEGTVDFESSIDVLTLLDSENIDFPYDVVFVDDHLIKEAPPIHDEVLSKIIVVAPLGVAVDEAYSSITRPVRREMVLSTIINMPKFLQLNLEEGKQRVLAVIRNENDIHSIDLIINSLSHDLTVVNKGLEGIELIRKKQFDFIFVGDDLADIEVGEFACRAREIDHTLPLVAISDQTQISFRLSCLNAGMEYYLRRPLSLERVSNIIDQICSTHFSIKYTSYPNRGVPPVFDYNELVNSTGSDSESVRQILQSYLRRSDEIIKKVDVSIDEKLDLDHVSALIHELKGSSANIYAMKLTETIREVEGSIRSSDLGEVRLGIKQVKNAKDELLQEIEKVMLS